MSKIYVDEIAGIASADTVAIPGHVIQVVQGTTTQATSSSSTFVDTGLSATITPTSVNSKILVTVAHPGTGVDATVGAGDRVFLQLVRGSTKIQEITNLAAYNNTTQRATETVTNLYLDSPATTSATTYKTQFRSNSSETIRISWNDGQSTITLMEIAG